MTTLAVMVCTIMQLLDTTIVNLTLPQMKGQLGVSPEQISWVLTSYVVATSIFTPLTGFSSDRIGIRAYLLVSIAGFTFTSLLCGLSTSLNQMVLFRIPQCVFGADLAPLSQMILIQLYPIDERARAMSIRDVDIMAGPIPGPSPGGWLTEHCSWHWTFFINVPIGACCWYSPGLPCPPQAHGHGAWTGAALSGATLLLPPMLVVFLLMLPMLLIFRLNRTAMTSADNTRNGPLEV